MLKSHFEIILYNNLVTFVSHKIPTCYISKFTLNHLDLEKELQVNVFIHHLISGSTYAKGAGLIH